jgi:hypothetical protein
MDRPLVGGPARRTHLEAPARNRHPLQLDGSGTVAAAPAIRTAIWPGSVRAASAVSIGHAPVDAPIHYRYAFGYAILAVRHVPGITKTADSRSVLNARSLAAALHSCAPRTTGKPYCHVAGITDALQAFRTFYAGSVVAAVFQVAGRWSAFVIDRQITVVTGALHFLLDQRASSMTTARVRTAFIGNATQTHRHVARIAFTRGGSVTQDAGSMAGTRHVCATGGNTTQAERRIPRFADAGRGAINLHAATMARAADAVAAFWRGTAIQTDSFITLVAHAMRLVVHHDAATETSAVDGEAVRRTGQRHVVIARIAVANGLALGVHQAFTMVGTRLVLAGVGLAFTAGIPRAAHRYHGYRP